MQVSTFPFGNVLKQEGRFQLVVGNEPRNWPGCYGIYDLRSGMWCVGSTSNVRRRRHEHENDSLRERTVFHRAVNEAADLEAFVFVPLYYFAITRRMLEEAETEMILSIGSLHPHGYNQYASKKDEGYWGVMRKGHDAALIKRRNESIALHHSAPDYREAQRQGTSKRKWYNNGTQQRRVPLGEQIPDGWELGRLPVKDSYREKMRYVSRESQNRPEVKRQKSEKAKKQWERQSAILARAT